MEYRSPLGYNFKLEKSLSASREEKGQESPSGDDRVSGGDSRPRKFFDSDNRRNSHRSGGWQRNSDHWKSPRNSQQDGPPPVEQFYHPSMLEDPWEELERNPNASKNAEDPHKHDMPLFRKVLRNGFFVPKRNAGDSIQAGWVGDGTPLPLDNPPLLITVITVAEVFGLGLPFYHAKRYVSKQSQE